MQFVCLPMHFGLQIARFCPENTPFRVAVMPALCSDFVARVVTPNCSEKPVTRTVTRDYLSDARVRPM
jgi:hypothetical protein